MCRSDDTVRRLFSMDMPVHEPPQKFFRPNPSIAGSVSLHNPIVHDVGMLGLELQEFFLTLPNSVLQVNDVLTTLR